MGSEEVCPCCDQARGFIYSGPMGGAAFRSLDVFEGPQREDVDRLCPWCIADGSAARGLWAEFAEIPERGRSSRLSISGALDRESGGSDPNDVPRAVLDELRHRTPAFYTWQSVRWLFHCFDGCAYVGTVGADALRAYPTAVQSVLEEVGMSGPEGEAYIDDLDADGSPSAYLFRCRHCGIHVAYSDCH